VELGPPIIEIDGDDVRLVPKWRENLDEIRRCAEEEEDERLQAEKIARQRERFHNPKKAGPEAEPTPKTPEREEVHRILQAAKERDKATRVELRRDKVGVDVGEFIQATLAGLGRIRMSLLREVWQDEGGNPAYIAQAVKDLGCRLEQPPGYELFVYPPKAPKPEPEAEPERAIEPEPAPVLPLRPSRKAATPPTSSGGQVVQFRRYEEGTGVLTTPVPSAEDWRGHDLDCGCGDCLYPPPKYARPYAGRRVGG
jgi:hypothetical protein